MTITILLLSLMVLEVDWAKLDGSCSGSPVWFQLGLESPQRLPQDMSVWWLLLLTGTTTCGFCMWPGLPRSMGTPFQIKHIKRATSFGLALEVVSFDLALEVAIHHLLQSQALPDSGGETTSPHLNERGAEITLYKVHVR